MWGNPRTVWGSHKTNGSPSNGEFGDNLQYSLLWWRHRGAGVYCTLEGENVGKNSMWNGQNNRSGEATE